MKQRVRKTIPKKHAERPVLVTRQVAVVAKSIVITAPGQDFRWVQIFWSNDQKRTRRVHSH